MMTSRGGKEKTTGEKQDGQRARDKKKRPKKTGPKKNFFQTDSIIDSPLTSSRTVLKAPDCETKESYMGGAEVGGVSSLSTHADQLKPAHRVRQVSQRPPELLQLPRVPTSLIFTGPPPCIHPS